MQETGCTWTGITISKAQLEEATRRVEAAGLGGRVQLVFCDYRDCRGAFDAVISCEMIEAVGQEHLRGYFQAIGRLLRPGGRAVIQVRGHVSCGGAASLPAKCLPCAVRQRLDIQWLPSQPRRPTRFMFSIVKP